MTLPSPGGLPRQRFRSRLAARPILVDGGMGTLLFSRGVPQRACLEELVANHPELVGAAHREYLEAGADLIETLSLGANRQRLAAWGLEGRVSQLNRRAAQLAREAREVSGRDALVGGSVGPLGSPARGLPDIGESAARATFREQIEGLLEGGADVIVLETFSDLEQLVLAVDEARAASDVPVIASLTAAAHGRPPKCWPAPAPTRSGSTAAPGRRPASTPSKRWAARPTARPHTRSCRTPDSHSGSRDASSTPPARSISER